MKSLGVVLVVLGVLALIYGGIQYSRQRTVIDLGPIQATATEHRRIPLPPIAAGVAILAGVVLLVVPRPRGTGRG